MITCTVYVSIERPFYGGEDGRRWVLCDVMRVGSGC